MYSSSFYCTQCGSCVLKGLPRKKGAQREDGHLKVMFCWNCNEKHNCVEITDFKGNYTHDEFLVEFERGNFNPDGTRKEPYKKVIADYIAEVEKEAKEKGIWLV
jgi:hypothetical protein